MEDNINGDDKAAKEGQLDLLPHEGIDWSRAAPVRRVWLEDIGGDHRARLEFLADQGLRLIMSDPGPAGAETLHFFNPRDRETLHLRAGEGKDLLCEAAGYFPAASRWMELLRGEGEREPVPRGPEGLLPRQGLLLVVRGGRVLRVNEALRYCPRAILYGAKTGSAASLLEKEAGTGGTALALAFIQALEEARGLKVPVAALALRAVLLEAARALGHLRWMETVASTLGRRRAAARCEGLLGELEEGLEGWLGDPRGRGWIVPGGVGEDFPVEEAAAFIKKLESVAGKWRELSPRVKSLPVPGWAEKRSRRLTVEAEVSGWVGPLARTAGLGVDARREEPGVYAVLGWEMEKAPADAGMFRRMLALRAGEVTCSLAAIKRILEDFPNGPLLVKRGRGGRGEGFGRCEGPEGETCCHLALEKGRISYAAFSLPHELNRSAAHVLEGCLLDEMDVLSLLWE